MVSGRRFAGCEGVTAAHPECASGRTPPAGAAGGQQDGQQARGAQPLATHPGVVARLRGEVEGRRVALAQGKAVPHFQPAALIERGGHLQAVDLGTCGHVSLSQDQETKQKL